MPLISYASIWNTFLVLYVILSYLFPCEVLFTLSVLISFIVYCFGSEGRWVYFSTYNVLYWAQIEEIEFGASVAISSGIFLFLLYAMRTGVRVFRGFWPLFVYWALAGLSLLFSAMLLSDIVDVSLSLTFTTLALFLYSISLSIVLVRVKGAVHYFGLSIISVGLVLFVHSLSYSLGEYGRFGIQELVGTAGISTLSNSLILMTISAYVIYCYVAELNVFKISRTNFGNYKFLTLASIALLGVLLSISRSAIVVIFFFLAVIFIQEIRKARHKYLKLSIIIVPIFLVVVIPLVFFGIDIINKETGGRLFTDIMSVVSGKDASFLTRLDIWRDAFSHNSFINWIFGNGLGSFRHSDGKYYEHSVVVSILYSGGLALLLVFIMFYIHLFVKSLRANCGAFLIFVFLTFLMFFAHGNLLDVHFWLLLSMSIFVAMYRRRGVVIK